MRVLATSREALGITGEVLVPVEPLPAEAAQRLFLDRARAVRPGFAGHACVPDVCRALDGLPLAIELAAARLRTLEPEELAAEKGAPRRFDLVVGADGLHSTTRRLVFGDESRHLRFLDHYVAGFPVPNHLGLDRRGLMYSEPGRCVAVGNYDGDPDHAGAMLVFRSKELTYDRRDLAAQKRILAERFAGMGWETDRVLAALADTDDLYFDAIAQIHVDRLTRGRVALLGDAGYSATMGGMGTGVAVVDAYVLAGELALAGGDHRTAFAAYESRIRDFAKGCQRISGNAGPFFAPPTRRRIHSRDRMYRLLASRPLAGFFRRLTEKAATAIELPDYPAVSGSPAA